MVENDWLRVVGGWLFACISVATRQTQFRDFRNGFGVFRFYFVLIIACVASKLPAQRIKLVMLHMSTVGPDSCVHGY